MKFEIRLTRRNWANWGYKINQIPSANYSPCRWVALKRAKAKCRKLRGRAIPEIVPYDVP
jgi:hypothetical protein